MKKRKVGRPATGLKHDLPITFRWNREGQKMIIKKAKALNISQAQYMRQLVEADCG